MKLHHLLFASLFGAAICSSKVQAAPMSYADLSNFRMEVADLAPDDGIDAVLDFTTRLFNFVGYYHRKKFLGEVGARLDLYGVMPLHAGFVAGGTVGNTSANGHALRADASVARGAIETTASFLQHFIISPNTKVTFSADWSSMYSDAWPLGSSSFGNLLAGLDNGQIEFRDSFMFPNGLGGATAGVARSGTMMVSFETGDSWKHGYVSGGVFSHAFNTQLDFQDVPEPGSILLFLGGLAILAGLLHRRS